MPFSHSINYTDINKIQDQGSDVSEIKYGHRSLSGINLSLPLFSSNLQFSGSYFHKADSKVATGFLFTMKVNSSSSATAKTTNLGELLISFARHTNLSLVLSLQPRVKDTIINPTKVDQDTPCSENQNRGESAFTKREKNDGKAKLI